jgi:hypothetical protein
MTVEQARSVRDNTLVVASGTQAGMQTQRLDHTIRQRFSRLIALCSLAAMLAACATAEERFEQGTALESTGQRSEAVHRYSQALRKDPGHLESRQRLIVLAPAVLDGHLLQSANDARREAFIDAADAVIAADGLIANMRALGITVAVPAGYASLRTGS